MYVEKEHASYKINDITLYPVARAGKSGSEVFYLDLVFEGHEFPKRCIAKFQDKSKTEQEASSARSAVIGNLCSSVASHEHPLEDLGIIVYSLAKSDDHIEFRGFFLDTENSDEQCATALKSIFQEIGKKPNGAVDAKNLIDDFAWYVDRKNKPLQRIDALTNVSAAQLGLGNLAKSIKDTYHWIERDMNVPVYPYLVHGDLHARNLMLSKSNPAKTELIDFGWVHSGHPAKDFVLMECTLKYMLLPELLPVLKGQSKDDLYIQARHIESFEKFLCEYAFDLPSKEVMLHAVFGKHLAPKHQIEALSRVYACLIEIRRAAGNILSKYCMEYSQSVVNSKQHYFASFFLVTLGLLGFSEVDQLWAMIGLQTIGDDLCVKTS